EQHLESARQVWPEIEVAPERFGGELARRLGADATRARLDGVKAADVYLAIACGDGDEAAIAAGVAIIDKEVSIAAAKTAATQAQGAEVAGTLRRVMFVDEPPRPAAVREYSGRGDLRSYVRVMAIRDLVRAVARGRREVPADADDLLDRIVP